MRWYSKQHIWIDDEFRTGLSDYAVKEIGEIVFIEQKKPGEKIAKDGVFAAIESSKSVFELQLPVAGEITEINSKLAKDPSKINKDPYKEGWIVKIEPVNENEIKELFDFESYKKFFKLG